MAASPGPAADVPVAPSEQPPPPAAKRPRRGKATEGPAAGTPPATKERKERKAKEVDPRALSGVLFIRSLPHGFYELQLRDYFGQFGTVYDVRVLRQRTTGNAKGLAWVQFARKDVATAAAEAMDNYLMFNKLLKCSHLRNEQVPTEVFKVKHVVPYKRCKARMHKFNKRKSIVEETRATKQMLHRLRRQQNKLAAAGLSYSMAVPELPKGLPVDVGRRRPKSERRLEAEKKAAAANPSEERKKRRAAKRAATAAAAAAACKRSASVDAAAGDGVKSEPEPDEAEDKPADASTSRYFSMLATPRAEGEDGEVKPESGGEREEDETKFETPPASPKKRAKRRRAATASAATAPVGKRPKRLRVVK